MNNNMILYIILMCSIVVSAVSAGEVVEITEKNLKDPNASENTIRFLFSENLMKMSGDDDSDMIFNSEDKNMLIISHPDKSYMTFDQNTVSDVKSEIDKAMEQALAQVPPEQRAMVEQMMKQRMSGMGGPSPIEVAMPKIEIRQTTRSDEINGYNCRYYESYQDGQKEGEHCVATWSELGVSDNIQNSFSSMAEMLESFLQEISKMTGGDVESNILAYMNEIEGYPVLSRQFSNGEATRESILSSIENKDIDPAEFMAPSGYRQQSMMGN